MSKNGYFEEDDLNVIIYFINFLNFRFKLSLFLFNFNQKKRFKPEFDDYNDLGGSDSNQLEDDYDAFNEDTFGNELG